MGIITQEQLWAGFRQNAAIFRKKEDELRRQADDMAQRAMVWEARDGDVRMVPA